MTPDDPEPLDVPGLPNEVLDRIVVELGRRGEKVIECLRTAAALISQAREDGAGLRLAESAAYNLREALDAVVEGRPVPKGGVGSAIEAWKQYQFAVREPGADAEAARNELDAVLARLEQDEERQAFKTRKLLEYVRNQTGIEPLPGEGDPTVRYSRLRERGNNILHDDGTVAGVAALYDDSVAWFVRFFTPPDERVRGIIALAERPFGEGRTEDLLELALNSHHLRLFFSRLRDPAWLDPLCDTGLIQPPRDDEPWPVTALVEGLGSVDPDRVAAVLDRLLTDSQQGPGHKRLGVARNILQSAGRLGRSGHPLVVKILAKYPNDRWVQMVAVSIASDSDASDPIQLVIADVVVGNEGRTDGGHYTRTMLARLDEGLTAENFADRIAMVTAKIRRIANSERMRFLVIDIAPLHTDDKELREPVLILSVHLCRMIARARDFGQSTNDLIKLVEPTSGELGERLVCRILTGADDVDRARKIAQVTRRLTSETATGDDRDLIADILATPLSPDELDGWRTAFGEPSPAPDADQGTDALGENWPRAWRWSMVLPSEVLEGWGTAIAAVTARYGEPSSTSLDTRIPRFVSSSGRSAHSTDELAALPVLAAAELVSAWRPSDDSWGVSARELARALEAAVNEKSKAWTEDPSAVVSVLREPVYIDHYFRAITQKASDLPDRTTAITAAVQLVRTERWPPSPLGRNNYDYEPDWSVVAATTVDMVASFANTNGDLASELDFCWELASELVRDLPAKLPGIASYESASDFDDPLNHAINRPYGKALVCVLSLGGWEHRNAGAASARLAGLLDESLAVPGGVGLELRAVLASRRTFLEAVAAEWLDARAADLFGSTPMGTITFDQTLKWSRPTKWFFDRYKTELTAAARRGADHAVSWLLLAFLWEVPEYSFASIVGGFAGNAPTLKALAEEMASLLQNAEQDDPMLERGLLFWADLLNEERGRVPAAALVGLGRWAFVHAAENERWFELMDRTLDLSDGEIDMPIEIANRCSEAQPSSRGLRMLRRMIGHGEPWEQDYVETAGLDALRAAAKHPVDEEFELLRTRLVQRGRHEASDIIPEA